MLKKALLALAVTIASLTATGVGNADTWVRGYVKSNGTYVQPHYRSTADAKFSNNWSTYPNVNPYTGRMGTRLTPPTRSYSFPSYRSPSYGTNSSRSNSGW